MVSGRHSQRASTGRGILQRRAIALSAVSCPDRAGRQRMLLIGCHADESATSNDDAAVSGSGFPTGSPSPTASADSTKNGAEDEQKHSQPVVRPISVLGLAQQRLRGDRLRTGRIREQTTDYTSYNVRYRSRTTTARGKEAYTITGVLNVPRGRSSISSGRVSARIHRAHGLCARPGDGAGAGLSGQSIGYIALHVDYRNHAGSDDDPLFQVRMRLGYSADVINAVKALRKSSDIAVDDDRMALFGRSMGGGVVLKALVAKPGVVQAAVPFASVSSLERQNYDQFIHPDPEDSSLRDQLVRRHRTPQQDPLFWRENSSRPSFDRITGAVLMVHGRLDDTCPPNWATATHHALTQADVQSQLEWYNDRHASTEAFSLR